MKKQGSMIKNAVVPETKVIPTTLEYNAELQQTMEKKENADLIRLFELKALGYKALAGWLKNIAKYNNTDKTMLIFKDRSKDRVFLRFYTSDNKYHISALRDTGNGESYLGCILVGRKPRPGENWDRGSDLPDGLYNKKTWNAIVNRIIAIEMKNLQCWR